MIKMGIRKKNHHHRKLVPTIQWGNGRFTTSAGSKLLFFMRHFDAQALSFSLMTKHRHGKKNSAALISIFFLSEERLNKTSRTNTADLSFDVEWGTGGCFRTLQGGVGCQIFLVVEV